VILDDVVDAARLAPIAGGPQMALLVTTQFGDALAAELARWLPGAAILRREIEGLTPADARDLCARALGRPLSAEDEAGVAQAGELLGWYLLKNPGELLGLYHTLSRTLLIDKPCRV